MDTRVKPAHDDTQETAAHFSGSSFFIEHDLVRKPLRTFRDQALTRA